MVKIRLMVFIVGIILCSWNSSNGFASAIITPANWQNNPQIKKIRSLYQITQKEISTGVIKKEARKYPYCEPYQDTHRVLFTGPKGRVKKYIVEAGSDDSTATWEYFFDPQGMLRFIFMKAGAGNGTKIEHRVYLNEKGKKIWEIQKKLQGPGYTFPQELPQNMFVRDPLKAFTANNPCEKK